MKPLTYMIYQFLPFSYKMKRVEVIQISRAKKNTNDVRPIFILLAFSKIVKKVNPVRIYD